MPNKADWHFTTIHEKNRQYLGEEEDPTLVFCYESEGETNFTQSSASRK